MRKLRKGEGYALLQGLANTLKYIKRLPRHCVPRNDEYKKSIMPSNGRSLLRGAHRDDVRSGRGVQVKEDLSKSYRPFKAIYKGNYNSSRTLFSLLMVCVVVLFSDAQAQSVGERAAEGLNEIRPLEIGDRVPEEVWNRIIPVLSPNGSISQISLQDYSHGIIILDFWGTWCSNCISGFPKLFELQDKFAGEKILFLPVVKQKEEIITRVMETTVIKDIPNFRTANDDGYLFDLFPTQGYPHVVIIIDKTVYAITKPEFINNRSVGDLINGRIGYIPTKRDTRDIINKSLLIPRFADIKQDKPIYYSTLMGLQDGLNPTIVFDRTAERTRWLIPNYNLWFIYELAWGYIGDDRVFEISNFPNRRIILTDNSEFHFDPKESKDYTQEQRKEFLRLRHYTYDMWMPPSLTRDEARKKLTQDVDQYLGVTTAVTMVNMPCYVLAELEKGVTKKRDDIEAMRTTRLTRYLNSSTFGLPPVVTDITSDNVPRIKLEDRHYSFEELNSLLHDFNLKLEKENRPIEMFVITDTGSTTAVDVDALELTHYGFTAKSKL